MDIKYLIDNPINLSEGSFSDFIHLLSMQGQIGIPNIDWIRNCFYLCVAYEGNKPIGIGAIKQLYESPFLHSECTNIQPNFIYELGYLFVIANKKYRNKGIGTTICQNLLEKIEKKYTYATTEPNSKNSMIHILDKLGFKQVGKTYKGQITGKDIGLYIYNG